MVVVQALLDMRHETRVRHADGNVIGGERAIQTRQGLHHLTGLIARAIAKDDVGAAKIDVGLQPRLRLHTAVGVEALGQGLRCEDERRDPVGHLVEHGTLGCIQVDGPG
jgi:hypothetical protein